MVSSNYFCSIFLKKLHYQSKVFVTFNYLLLHILKVLFLTKKVKHHKVFIYNSKSKSFSVTLAWVEPDIFWKIDLTAFYFL